MSAKPISIKIGDISGKKNPASWSTNPNPTPLFAFVCNWEGMNFVVSLTAYRNRKMPTKVHAKPEFAKSRIYRSSATLIEYRFGLLRAASNRPMTTSARPPSANATTRQWFFGGLVIDLSLLLRLASSVDEQSSDIASGGANGLRSASCTCSTPECKRSLNDTRRVILPKRVKKHKRNHGLSQYIAPPISQY